MHIHIDISYWICSWYVQWSVPCSISSSWLGHSTCRRAALLSGSRRPTYPLHHLHQCLRHGEYKNWDREFQGVFSPVVCLPMQWYYHSKGMKTNLSQTRSYSSQSFNFLSKMTVTHITCIIIIMFLLASNQYQQFLTSRHCLHIHSPRLLEISVMEYLQFHKKKTMNNDDTKLVVYCVHSQSF